MYNINHPLLTAAINAAKKGIFKAVTISFHATFVSLSIHTESEFVSVFITENGLESADFGCQKNKKRFLALLDEANAKPEAAY